MLTFFKEVIRQHYLILLVAIFSAVFWPQLKEQYYGYLSSKTDVIEKTTSDVSEVKLFTKTELATYNGLENSPGMYLAIMGDVYDVEKGAKHYGKGGTYNFFVGRDASTSFISGEFEKVTDSLDDVLTLQPRDILSLSEWKKFYDKEYIYKGRLIGRFYDNKGQETEYFGKVREQIEIALEDKRKEEMKNFDFPPCNIEWSAETGTKVWCTKQSGGVDRNWVGVPRKYFETGGSNYRCACVKTSKLKSPKLKEYDDCDPKSATCFYELEN